MAAIVEKNYSGDGSNKHRSIATTPTFIWRRQANERQAEPSGGIFSRRNQYINYVSSRWHQAEYPPYHQTIWTTQFWSLLTWMDFWR